MSHPHAHHGPAQVLAENGLGQVSTCSCGVLTLTVACVSLRFEPGAFDELAALIQQARLARHQAVAGAPARLEERGTVELAGERTCVH